MIVKMKFLQISGPESDIDRMCEQYLAKYEMQLENAVAELKTTNHLLPFIEVNPFREPLAKAEEYCKFLKKGKFMTDHSMTKREALDLIREINHDYIENRDRIELLKKEENELREQANVLEPFRSLNVDLQNVAKNRYIRFRFGRIGLGYYNRMKTYLHDDMKAIFIKDHQTESYVYGCYAVADVDKAKVDNLFSSLHFERIDLMKAFHGTPAEAYRELNERREAILEEIKELEEKTTGLMESHASKLLGAREELDKHAAYFDIRKKAARSFEDTEEEEGKECYYVLCGWMGEEDAQAFIEETKDDDLVMVMVEEDREKYFGDPPTKLKNPKFFKPFEMYVEMYGLPAANEMDPTIFIALSYTFIFGAMFGDLGQGAVLFLAGGLLYLTKKISLAGIISIAGLFSMFFGMMFGSVFGFEDIIPALWLKPSEAMTNLPFIGQLNTVFIVAVAFGMAMNILVMIFQVINAWKAKDLGNMLFSHNGIAGIVFYGFIVLTVVLYMTGHKTPGNVLLAIFLGGPILAFLFKEPLGNLVSKRHEKMETGKVMFFVQGFFELFETMLSYFSNTLSYVRVGAFAVSHAAMMGVVLMLSGAESGNLNMAGVIFGNLFVMGMEGLIVGIQVLRLEYYEMFSRFYKGSGKQFKPFNRKQNQGGC
ncbi:MAG: V-type ATPase 116kDa subunit family protein [Eubacteriales bacterium]|nr:V-type ATPase 116kDa subunit family protein [Eubacteriales bacterium]